MDQQLRDRPTGDLVRDLSTQVSTLVRQELELAKVELSDKGKEARLGIGLLGGAGVVALFGVGALTAAAILALDTAMAGWLAAIVVALVWLAIAGVMALVGKTHAQRGLPPAPEQTVESVKEDVRWTRDHVQAARR
jgi:membrane protein